MAETIITINAEKNIKNIRKEFQKHGVFYSSTALAETLKRFLSEDVKEVYDPTCGAGSLLSVFGDDVRKYGQELDPGQAQIAQEQLTNAEIVVGDTLKTPAFSGRKFEAIVANPPFSLKWEPMPEDERFKVAPAMAPKSKADFAFILHCLHYLSDTGVCATISAPGVLYRGAAEGKIRKWLIESNYIDKVYFLGSGHFTDTSIPVVALVLRKDKTSTDIYIADTTLDMGRAVPLKEIQENGYSLNVSQYVYKMEPEPEYDVEAEFGSYLKTIPKTLKTQFEVCQMMLEIEPNRAPMAEGYSNMLEECREVLDSARQNQRAL